MPEDSAQLLFLAGTVCLVIAPRLSWWPAGFEIAPEHRSDWLNRQIEAVQSVEVGNRHRGGLGPKHGSGFPAGDELAQEEDDQGHPEDHHDRLEEPPEDDPDHRARPRGTAPVSGIRPKTGAVPVHETNVTS